MATILLETLALTTGEPVARIHFNRPALANRFDSKAHQDLVAALGQVAADDAACVVVLSAEGRIFSAGGDFDEILAANTSAAVREDMTRLARALFTGMLDCPVPIVAAVQGAAVGLGATIVSLCDLSVAAQGVKISDPHVAVGLVAGDGGIIGWAQSIGVNRAKRFLLTGEAMTAQTACELGLVSEVVPTPDDVLPRALQLAGHIAGLPRLAIRGTRRAFSDLTRQYGLVPFETGIAAEMESIAHPDVVERVNQLRR